MPTALAFLSFVLQPIGAFANEELYNQTRQGLIYLESGAFEKAVTIFTSIIKSNPDDGYAYLYRARAYDGLGRFELALQDLDMADKLDSVLAKSGTLSYASSLHLERANTFLAMKKYRRACDTISDFMKANPNFSKDPEGRRVRALAYAGLREYQKALEDIAYTIGWYISGSSGEPSEQRRRDLQASNDFDLQGEWLMKAGRGEEAIDSLSNAIKANDLDKAFNPERAELYLKRAKIYRILGEDALARRDEQRALAIGKGKQLK